MIGFKEQPNPKCVAHIRFIAAKHAIDSSQWQKTSVTLLHSQTFQIGLIGNDHEWTVEEVSNSAEELIEEALRGKEEGYYEIVADFCFDSWRCSYEYDEYDSCCELQNEKVIRISYENAHSYYSEILQSSEELLMKEEEVTKWQLRHAYWMSSLIVSPWASTRSNYRALITALLVAKESKEAVPDIKTLSLKEMSDLSYLIALDVPAEKTADIMKLFNKALNEHESIFGKVILDFEGDKVNKL